MPYRPITYQGSGVRDILALNAARTANMNQLQQNMNVGIDQIVGAIGSKADRETETRTGDVLAQLAGAGDQEAIQSILSDSTGGQRVNTEALQKAAQARTGVLQSERQIDLGEEKFDETQSQNLIQNALAKQQEERLGEATDSQVAHRALQGEKIRSEMLNDKDQADLLKQYLGGADNATGGFNDFSLQVRQGLEDQGKAQMVIDKRMNDEVKKAHSSIDWPASQKEKAKIAATRTREFVNSGATPDQGAEFEKSLLGMAGAYGSTSSSREKHDFDTAVQSVRGAMSDGGNISTLIEALGGAKKDYGVNSDDLNKELAPEIRRVMMSGVIDSGGFEQLNADRASLQAEFDMAETQDQKVTIIKNYKDKVQVLAGALNDFNKDLNLDPNMQKQIEDTGGGYVGLNSMNKLIVDMQEDLNAMVHDGAKLEAKNLADGKKRMRKDMDTYNMASSVEKLGKDNSKTIQKIIRAGSEKGLSETMMHKAIQQEMYGDSFLWFDSLKTHSDGLKDMAGFKDIITKADQLTQADISAWGHKQVIEPGNAKQKQEVSAPEDERGGMESILVQMAIDQAKTNKEKNNLKKLRESLPGNAKRVDTVKDIGSKIVDALNFQLL